MSKVITDTKKLFASFVSIYGHCDAETFAKVIQKHTSDAVVAVTAEDIAQLMVADYNFRNVNYEQIENGTDEYFSILNHLAENIAVDRIVREIEGSGSLDSGFSSQTIRQALHDVYEDEELSTFMILAINNYH